MGTPILGILSKLQRELDVLDIEGLSELWFKTQESGESSGSPADMPDPTISDWMTLVDTYHSSHKTKDHSQPRVADIQYYVHAYLLSATFKDCSIFVRLCRNSGGSWVGITANPITVIDLDTKKPNRLQRWAELDGDIVERYAEVENKRHCVDAQAEPEVPCVPRT
jgi:inositol-pentakisphosphate 2-kinase